MHRLPRETAAEAARLLRVLFLRLGAMPADPDGAFRRWCRGVLLYEVIGMASDTLQRSNDWVRCPRVRLLAWWIPQGAILVGLFVPVSVRATLWVVALLLMGTACLLNAKRCGRTHCRYTGPYYLAMIVPVLVLASGMATAGSYEWLILGVLILAGSKIIWWATERAWGKFSSSRIWSIPTRDT